jgi:hypothetical protein
MTKTRNELSAKERKDVPLYRGLLKYFPDALMEVAHLSKVGNDQHNPGQPLHWAKEKSTDEPDALMRHLIDAGTRDSDGERHSAKVAWRALAMLQREIEAEQEEQQGQVLTDDQAYVDKLGQAVQDCERTGGEWRNGNCYTKTVTAEQQAVIERTRRQVEMGDFGELVFTGTPFKSSLEEDYARAETPTRSEY